MQSASIIPHRVTDSDRCRLGSLLNNQASHAWGDPHSLADLESKLEGAQPLRSCLAPETLVMMNTTVRLRDLISEKDLTATLVYPDDVDLISGGVSIYKPLGVALLGCQIGDVLQCPVDGSDRRFRVDEVLYQPEQDKAFHL